MKKTKKIRGDTTPTVEEAIKRVEKQVEDKVKNIQPFELKPIKRQKLRKLMKKSKGGNASGYDNIDGKSLKLQHPYWKKA